MSRRVASRHRLSGWLHARLARRVAGSVANRTHRSVASIASIAEAIDLLGRGKDGTLVYPASQIPKRFASDACVVVRRASTDRRRRTAVGCIAAIDAAALRNAGLDEDVALKDVRDEASAKAEAAIHAHLRACFSRKMNLCALHPDVVSVTIDDHALIPMRVGASIDAAFAKANKAEDLLSIARGVLGALAVMHGNGVLHLDVKPHNILVVKGAYVLVDYDLTAHFDDVLDALRDGPVPVGTPGYISPILLGRVEPAYARVCAFVSSAATRAACARFAVDVPSVPLDDAAWAERFSMMRYRAMSSSSAATELLPQIDLHSLAVTLHRLYGSLEDVDSTAAARLRALIAGLVGGGFDDAAEAIKLCATAASASPRSRTARR